MVDKILEAVFVIFLLFVVYLFFVFLPVVVYNESKCLSLGYPEARVTFTLERYCIGLEGSTKTVVVGQ